MRTLHLLSFTPFRSRVSLRKTKNYAHYSTRYTRFRPVLTAGQLHNQRRQRVTFVLKQANTVILQETYTQDANNQIHILDLFSLMEPYLIGSPMLQFSYEVSASSETTISKTFTVLLCRPIIPAVE